MVLVFKSNFDFSFSGLKTAVRTLCAKNQPLSTTTVADIALEFEIAVCEVLARKLVTAARKYNAREIHLTGGVSANQRLRETIATEISRADFQNPPAFFYPVDLNFCTDNAAMIGAAAFFTGRVVEHERLRTIV